jgi:hypothetical protein
VVEELAGTVAMEMVAPLTQGVGIEGKMIDGCKYMYN